MSYDFFAAMLVGFLGGGHCLGMCGGIVGAFSTNIPPHHRLAIRHRIPYLISSTAFYAVILQKIL